MKFPLRIPMKARELALVWVDSAARPSSAAVAECIAEALRAERATVSRVSPEEIEFYGAGGLLNIFGRGTIRIQNDPTFVTVTGAASLGWFARLVPVWFGMPGLLNPEPMPLSSRVIGFLVLSVVGFVVEGFIYLVAITSFAQFFDRLQRKLDQEYRAGRLTSAWS